MPHGPGGARGRRVTSQFACKPRSDHTAQNLEYGYSIYLCSRRRNAHTFDYLQYSSTCAGQYRQTPHSTASLLVLILSVLVQASPKFAFKIDAPNAPLIVLWQSSPRRLPVPHGPRTPQEFTYMRNRRVILPFVLSLSSHRSTFARTIP